MPFIISSILAAVPNVAQLGRLSSNFALSADLALVLGGRLKFEEMLSGRFADAFGTLYLGYSCLWYYKQLKESGRLHSTILSDEIRVNGTSRIESLDIRYHSCLTNHNLT